MLSRIDYSYLAVGIIVSIIAAADTPSGEDVAALVPKYSELAFKTITFLCERVDCAPTLGASSQ